MMRREASAVSPRRGEESVVGVERSDVRKGEREREGGEAGRLVVRN